MCTQSIRLVGRKLDSSADSPSQMCLAAGWKSAQGVAIVACLSTACHDTYASGDRVYSPEVATAMKVPLSTSNEIVLLADERTACVIESYEYRVHCVSVDGNVVGSFGALGEGPGEFGSPGLLVRGNKGTVGVVDTELGRFTVFTPNGSFVTDVKLLIGGGLDPIASFDTMVSGVVMDPFQALGAASGAFLSLVEVNIASGEIVRREASPPLPREAQCSLHMTYGVPDPVGGWVLIACEGKLVFVADDGDATVRRAPTYVEEFPDERDVARRAEELGIFNAGLAKMGLSPSRPVEERLEAYRATPKRYHLSTRQRRFDGSNRFWIATQRDLHEWSYLDVFENTDYVGSVRVRDQLRGFDLLGSTLVVLVDRRVDADDGDSIPDRVLHWYDIADMVFGR